MRHGGRAQRLLGAAASPQPGRGRGGHAEARPEGDQVQLGDGMGGMARPGGTAALRRRGLTAGPLHVALTRATRHTTRRSAAVAVRRDRRKRGERRCTSRRSHGRDPRRVVRRVTPRVPVRSPRPTMGDPAGRSRDACHPDRDDERVHKQEPGRKHSAQGWKARGSGHSRSGCGTGVEPGSREWSRRERSSDVAQGASGGAVQQSGNSRVARPVAADFIPDQAGAPSRWLDSPKSGKPLQTMPCFPHDHPGHHIRLHRTRPSSGSERCAPTSESDVSPPPRAAPHRHHLAEPPARRGAGVRVAAPRGDARDVLTSPQRSGGLARRHARPRRGTVAAGWVRRPGDLRDRRQRVPRADARRLRRLVAPPGVRRHVACVR